METSYYSAEGNLLLRKGCLQLESGNHHLWYICQFEVAYQCYFLLCLIRYGRKLTVCLDLIIYTIGSVPLPWTENRIALLFLRFLAGVGGVGYYQIAFILGKV